MDDAGEAKRPHLHVRSVEGGLLFGHAIAITGNATALLQLRRQIDRALAGPDAAQPFEEAVYDDVYGQPFEVAVKRARSPEEMQEPVPKPTKTPEKLPWMEIVRRQELAHREKERRGGGQP